MGDQGPEVAMGNMELAMGNMEPRRLADKVSSPKGVIEKFKRQE